MTTGIGRQVGYTTDRAPVHHRACVILSVSYLYSSVGLAKAALEAINGFNLFGNQVFE